MKRIPKTITFTPGAFEKLQCYAAEREIDLSNAICLLIVEATSEKMQTQYVQPQVGPVAQALLPKRPVGRPPTKSSPEMEYNTWLNQGDVDPEGKHYKGFVSLSTEKKVRLMQISEEQRQTWMIRMIELYADKEDEMSFSEFLVDKIT